MAKTRPTGEQLRFRSQYTGDHVLDSYMEASEKGGRPVYDLLDDLFDPNTGNLNADNFEFQYDPAAQELQVRVGQYAGVSSGWQNITSFFAQRGIFDPNTTYKNLDTVVIDKVGIYVIHGVDPDSTISFTDESDLQASTNTQQIVDIGEPYAWATKTDGQVDGTDYSAKAYAIGGQGVDDTIGSAKDWAIKESGTVDGTNRSAKYYATSPDVQAVANNLSTVNEAANAANKAQAAADSAQLSDAGAATSESIARNAATTATDKSEVATTKAQEADTSATNAQNSENAAATSESNAATSESNALTSENNAKASEDEAQDWANKTGGTVDGTLYSAKYWATHPDVITVSDDLQGADTIGTVSTNIANVNNVGTDIANVNSVATNMTDVGAVASNVSSVQSVAAIDSKVTTVANNITDVTSVGDTTIARNAYQDALALSNTGLEHAVIFGV